MAQDVQQEAEGALSAPSIGQTAVLAAYTEAIKGALTAADSAAAAVGAAAFSLATAYGALVGLVAAKPAPPSFVLVLPFIGFAASAVVSTWAKFFGAEIDSENGIAEIQHILRRNIRWKRTLGSIGLATIVVSMIGTGILVTVVWGPGR